MPTDNQGAPTLAPCPFCGAKDVGGVRSEFHCYSCKADIRFPSGEVEAWNRRPPSPTVGGGGAEPFMWVCPNCYHQAPEPGKHVSPKEERESGETGAPADHCDHEMIALYASPLVRADAAPAQEVRDALFSLLSDLERHTANKGFNWPKDHACDKCLFGYADEYRNGVIPGFLCARHKAHEILNPKKVTDAA
jgi:hypothetical protein